MVVVVNGNLMGRQNMQVVSEIDRVAIQTDGKNIQTQKQRKDRSGFSGHSWMLYAGLNLSIFTEVLDSFLAILMSPWRILARMIFS